MRKLSFPFDCSLLKLLSAGLFFPAFGLIGVTANAQESPPVENPYAEYYATVVRKIDGDTVAVSAALWPGRVAEYSVRERGIDSPEMKRVGCEEERE